MILNFSSFLRFSQIAATIAQIADALKKKEASFQDFLNKYGRFLSAQQRRQPLVEDKAASDGAKAAASVLV